MTHEVSQVKYFRISSLLIVAALALSACGTDAEPTDGLQDNATPEGEEKREAGKADAWNWRNDPARFRAEMTYDFAKLPETGKAPTPWTANYWPNYEDSINHRWQGKDVLSPAEKFDVAFHGWEATEAFMALKPFDTSTCEWDQEYYDSLGPVADWTSRNKGNLKSRNGRDDDGDGIEDKDECKSMVGDKTNEEKRDGVETWWGICHAWAPAAVMEAEPLGSVERNGVTFDVSDQKALLMMDWDKSSAFVVGGRCNEKEVERNPITGRVDNDECRDLNAGAWHVIISSLIGIEKRGFVIERTWDYEVWNQPLFGYEVTLNKEISLERAHELLNVESFNNGDGEEIHGVREGSNAGNGVLNLVNGATLPILDDEVALDSRAAKGILAFRAGDDEVLGTNDDVTYKTLTELEETTFVGESAFTKLLAYAKDNGFVPLEYAYNEKAVKFVEIRMTTDWLTEQHPTKERTDNVISRYTRHDRYHYVLELDADDKVIGGEWLDSSIAAHPDFVWLPVQARGGNPKLDIDQVREMVAEGRRNILGDVAEGKIVEASSNDEVAIPDNDENGAASIINVTDEGKVRTVTIDLNIDHTYRGDLTVQLRHGSVSVPVFDGRSVNNKSEDHVKLTAEVINGFEGTDVSGDWELVVIDTWAADTGSITDWKLNFEVE
jgi:subtilisin-like proprotein convertase family protein